MTSTSGPGFTLMQEGIGYACLTQTPCVVVNVMRGGPATGQPTISAQQDVYQARYGCHGDYESVVLAPSSAQVWVLTGEGTRENADNAVWAGSYRWLRLETDGQQQWLSIKQP